MAGEANKARAAELLAQAQQAVRDAGTAEAAQAARDRCVEQQEWVERLDLIFPDE